MLILCHHSIAPNRGVDSHWGCWTIMVREEESSELVCVSCTLKEVSSSPEITARPSAAWERCLGGAHETLGVADGEGSSSLCPCRVLTLD